MWWALSRLRVVVLHPVGGELKVYENSSSSCGLALKNGHSSVCPMRDLVILAIHLVVTFVKLLRPGGVRAIVAESLALKHQLLISNRSHRRAPSLTTLDRIVLAEPPPLGPA